MKLSEANKLKKGDRLYPIEKRKTSNDVDLNRFSYMEYSSLEYDNWTGRYNISGDCFDENEQRVSYFTVYIDAMELRDEEDVYDILTCK